MTQRHRNWTILIQKLLFVYSLGHWAISCFCYHSNVFYNVLAFFNSIRMSTYGQNGIFEAFLICLDINKVVKNKIQLHWWVYTFYLPEKSIWPSCVYRGKVMIPIIVISFIWILFLENSILFLVVSWQNMKYINN